MTILEKLKNGQNIYGTCITSTAPLWPAAIKSTGVDFVFIDTEHVPLGRAELAQMCQSFKALGITPIVRIPNPDPSLACQAIDGGAKGIVAPYLESKQQIIDLVGATKFRPLKGEKLVAYLKPDAVIPPEMAAYLTKYNHGNMCIANIESVTAMENLDELLSVPGLDAVFIGPHDLSVSMGLPEDYDHPEFEKAVQFIIRTTRAKGLSIGIHFSLAPERQIQWIKEGVNIIVHSFDVALFVQKLKSDLQLIKAYTGDGQSVESDTQIVI